MSGRQLTLAANRLPAAAASQPQCGPPLCANAVGHALSRLAVQERRVRRRGWWALGAIVAMIVLAAGVVHIGGAIALNGQVRAGGEPIPVRAELGGKVLDVLVAEGARVQAGQTLLRLDRSRELAAIADMRAKQDRIQADAARLRALIDGSEAIDADLDKDLLAEQNRLLWLERDSLRQERLLIDAQIAGNAAQLQGLNARIAAQKRELAVTLDELAGLRSLFERGLTAQARVRGLERLAEGLRGKIAASETERSALQNGQAEIEQQFRAGAAVRQAQWQKEWQNQKDRALELAGERRRLELLAARATIPAQAAGVIMNSAVRTPGTVVGAGETLMEIVTIDQTPRITARLDLVDIERVTVGQNVTVDLSTIDAIQAKRLDARIVGISADATLSGSGRASYKIDVELNDRSAVLAAGTPVRVLIPTEENSLLHQLLAPLNQRISIALAAQ